MFRHRIVAAGLVLLILGLLIHGCSDDNPTEPEARTTATITTPAMGDTLDGLAKVVMEGFGTTKSGQQVVPTSTFWYLDEGIPDSLIGHGTSQSVYMPPGDRKIILRVFASISDSADATVDIHVEAPDNYPPIPRIIEPFDGEDFLPAHVVTVLTGNAFDIEDGYLPPESLSWKSDIQGDLGTGERLEARLLTGDHAIILTATDSEGLAASDTIRVTTRSRANPLTVAGDFYFQANEFNSLCADKEFVWLIGDFLIETDDEVTHTSEMTIYDMSGTLTCDMDNLCFLSGEEALGNIRVLASADDGEGGTIQLEISLAVTDGNTSEGIVGLTGLVRGIETPEDGAPCVYRSRIQAAARVN